MQWDISKRFIFSSEEEAYREEGYGCIINRQKNFFNFKKFDILWIEFHIITIIIRKLVLITATTFKMCGVCPQWPDRCCLCFSRKGGVILTGILSILDNICVIAICIYTSINSQFWVRGNWNLLQ